MSNGIFRKRENKFTQVSNLAISGNNLSLKALGLYTKINYYLNIPNFDLYKAHLFKVCEEGKTAFESCWKELKDKGYLLQFKLKDGITKQFYYEYELLDEPIKNENQSINEKTEEKATTSFSRSGFSRSGFSTSGKQGSALNNTISNNNINNNTKENNTSINQSPDGLNDDFSKLVDDFNNTLRTDEVKIMTNKPELIDEIILNIAEMYISSSVKISGETKPQAIIRHSISRLTISHILDIVNNYLEISRTTKISNVKSYLQSMIYNMPYQNNAQINNYINHSTE